MLVVYTAVKPKGHPAVLGRSGSKETKALAVSQQALFELGQDGFAIGPAETPRRFRWRHFLMALQLTEQRSFQDFHEEQCFGGKLQLGAAESPTAERAGALAFSRIEVEPATKRRWTTEPARTRPGSGKGVVQDPRVSSGAEATRQPLFFRPRIARPPENPP